MNPSGKGLRHIGHERRCGARAAASTRHSPQNSCEQHGVATDFAATSGFMQIGQSLIVGSANDMNTPCYGSTDSLS